MGPLARRFLTWGVLIAILAVISLLGAIGAGPTSPLETAELSGRFPAVLGTTLNGERIALPDFDFFDFANKHGVVTSFIGSRDFAVHCCNSVCDHRRFG